jgi:hypothetical protein
MFQRLALFALRCSALTLTLSSLVSGRAAAAPEAPAAPEAAPIPETRRAPEAAPAPETPPAPDPEGALIALARDLELVVTELGPDMPWTLHLHNRGPTPIGLMADPGLLWFEVVVPGTPTPQVCRLPEPLWPKGMRRRAEVLLSAGARFSRRFDPRFFCFSDRVQTTLVPDARVIPHFGWPQELRSTVVKGKRVDQPLPSRAPFVAWALSGVPATPEPVSPPNPDSDENDAEPTAEAPWQPPTEGLKNIVGTAIVLSPAYAKWSERPHAPTEGLQVAMLAGSDAEDERAATVTVGLGNAGDTAQLVVVRRELISFDVLGPDGSFECPTVDTGTPDVESFTSLGVRASEQLVVRLIEMCPRGSFSRPGLYEVRATWHGKFSGQALGLDAFVGTVTSPQPTLVRVRSGERSSFLRAAPMVATGKAAKAGTAARAAGEGSAEAPPADEGPADRDGAPDEAPAAPEPPAAPEGTSVE